MKHVLAVLVIAALFAVAASGRARRSSKVHHPHQRRPPMLLSRLLRGTLSVPLCRQRTRCAALRAGPPRGRAIA